MEIRQLQYVVRLAETLHFGKAAELEYIAPSVLSTQVRKLESRLGVELFERTPHQVLITPAGAHFVEEAEAILQRLTRLESETQSIAAGATETLNVGFFGEALGELTHPVFAEFGQYHPKVRLQFTELSMNSQFEDLKRGIVDVAFVRLPIQDENLIFKPLYQEKLYAAVSINGPLGGRKSVTVQEIIDLPFAIAGDTTPSDWAGFWTLDGIRGSPGRVGAVVRTLNESLSAIAYGDAIDTFPASATRTFSHPGVVFVPIEDAPASVLAFTYRKDNESEAILHLLQVVQSVVVKDIELMPEAESLVDQ